jgi:ABC-type transport system substrate-binding protein
VLVSDMKAIGIRVEINVAQWPENLKAARAGNYQMWSVGSSAASPDGSGAFQRYDSRQIGGQNMARVRLPQFDELYDKLEKLPDGPDGRRRFARPSGSRSPTCRTSSPSTASRST